MFKGDDEMREFIKKYGSILLITILIGALISVFISMAVYGRIGMTGNQATMYAGFLGLVGGIAGAMSAFVVAQIQLKNQFIQQQEILKTQFEQQIIMDKEKIKTEIQIENLQEIMSLLTRIRNEFIQFNNYYYNLFRVLITYKEHRKDNYKKELDVYNQKIRLIMQNINEYPKYQFLYENTDEFFNFYNNNLVDFINKLDENHAEIEKIIMNEELTDENMVGKIKEIREKVFDFFDFVKPSIEREINRYSNEIKTYLSSEQKGV